METQSRNAEVSVCRAFYEKFPLGNKERVHEELVKFIMSHSSSRKKLEEWLLSKETQRHKKHGSRSKISSLDQEKNAYDDTGSTLTATDQNCGCSACNRDHATVGATASISPKCDNKSKFERELGNQRFKKKDLRNSLRHYNSAIRYSCFPSQPENVSNCSKEKNSNEKNNCLAIAFANRSAVLHELGESYYDKALMDIESALKYGYPERLKTKLLMRKVSILTKQGKCQTAQELLTNIKASLCEKSTTETANLANVVFDNMSTGNTTDTKINDLEMQIKQLLNNKLPKSADSLTEQIFDNFHENENFENASDQVSIRVSKDLGRHVIAMADIQEGDMIFKEMPFASVLLPEFHESHCHHCHKKLTDDQTGEIYFFPCSNCTQVLFCDNLCADAARMYHAHECGWLELLHSVGIAHLAVRIVLVAGVETILKCVINHASFDDIPNLQIFKKGMNNYNRVYSLVDHIADMYEEDLFQYTLTASLLTRFLVEKTSFCESLTEQQHHQIGGAILRHICQLVCNAHAVTDVLPDATSTPSEVIVDERQKRIATAIFPAASIMNHSCDSNIMFYFVDGKKLIVKGAQAIRNGGNVYNCYGPHFRRMPRNERQEILMQQYFFACDCNKCEEERNGMSFADQFQALKCEDCKGPVYLSQDAALPCANCGKVQNMKTETELLNLICDLQRKGEYLLQQGRGEEAKEAFQSAYISASHILFKYNSEFGKICDSLARCYVMTGDRNEAKKLLKKSLEYVEIRFGRTSGEFVKELRKYEEVCAG